MHYPSEKVGLFWNLLVTAVRRHFYFEGEHSVLFWVTFLQVSLQFSHCQQPKQLQDGFCRKTLTAWGPRPFSKRLLGVAGSVVKTFIVPYRNFFISALARTTCMENITNRLPFYLQFANLSANKNNMLPTSMESEGGNVLENKRSFWYSTLFATDYILPQSKKTPATTHYLVGEYSFFFSNHKLLNGL